MGLPFRRDRLFNLLTRCVQEPALAQGLGSYTRLSLRERERWMSETISGTLQVDPARINAARVYCSSLDFERGVKMHVRLLFSTTFRRGAFCFLRLTAFSLFFSHRH